MRSQGEILERVRRFRNSNSKDFFGWREDVLITRLLYSNAKEFLGEEVTLETWGRVRKSARREEILDDTKEYLRFAIRKAVGHRGISASRSVEKLGEFLWLLQADDLIRSFSAAQYSPYGAPKLRVLEVEWGLRHDFRENDVWAKMRLGRSCRRTCQGCGVDVSLR